MFATRDVLKFVQPKWCSFEFQVFTSPSEGREPLQAMVIATRAFRPYLRRIFQKQIIHGWFSCVSLKWSLNNRRVQPTWPQDVEIIDASRLWDSQRRPRGLSLEKLVLPQQVAFGHPSAPTDLWRFLLVSKRSLYFLCRLWTYRNWTKQGCLKSVKSWYFVPTKFNPGTTLTAAQTGRGMCEMCMGNKALWGQQNLLGWAQFAQCIEKGGPWYLLCL
jgi:hypothetical protein